MWITPFEALYMPYWFFHITVSFFTHQIEFSVVQINTQSLTTSRSLNPYTIHAQAWCSEHLPNRKNLTAHGKVFQVQVYLDPHLVWAAASKHAVLWGCEINCVHQKKLERTISTSKKSTNCGLWFMQNKIQSSQDRLSRRLGRIGQRYECGNKQRNKQCDRRIYI